MYNIYYFCFLRPLVHKIQYKNLTRLYKDCFPCTVRIMRVIKWIKYSTTSSFSLFNPLFLSQSVAVISLNYWPLLFTFCLRISLYLEDISSPITGYVYPLNNNMMFNVLWHLIYLSNVEHSCLYVTGDKGQKDMVCDYEV